MADRMDIQAFYDGLDQLFERKNTAETMAYLEQWLTYGEQLNDAAGLTAVCNELGALCRVTGQFERAKLLYQRVLLLLEEMGLSGTEHYATALINFGDVYIASKELHEALLMFLDAKQLLQDCGLGGDYRMAALCNNISAVYRQTGQFAEAENALNTAFNIIKGLPQCRGELATTYVNLGELQTRQNKLEMAKESFLAAIGIFETETGGKDVHFSSACAGLGGVYFLRGNFAEAESWYIKSLQLIERDFGRTPFYDLVAANLEKVRRAM